MCQNVDVMSNFTAVGLVTISVSEFGIIHCWTTINVLILQSFHFMIGSLCLIHLAAAAAAAAIYTTHTTVQLIVLHMMC